MTLEPDIKVDEVDLNKFPNKTDFSFKYEFVFNEKALQKFLIRQRGINPFALAKLNGKELEKLVNTELNDVAQKLDVIFHAKLKQALNGTEL